MIVLKVYRVYFLAFGEEIHPNFYHRAKIYAIPSAIGGGNSIYFNDL